ncbi:hypothetical protein AB0I92_16000 [Micromonospora chalcea]|uniref:hypothetical protein n=1 Tax=Micromonospora chalcea TaxID=1874 RepID=UPI0033D87F39
MPPAERRPLVAVRPQPGDLLRVDGRASVQFGGDRALTFRVVSVGPEMPHTDWIWLTGYVLNRRGTATVKREIFVQTTFLRRIAQATARQVTGQGGPAGPCVTHHVVRTQ